MKPASRPDTAPSLSPFALEEEEQPPQVSPERRRKLTRYVAATVCVCVALCLTALVRVAVAHVKGDDEGPVARVSSPTPVAAAAPAAAPTAAPEAPTPRADALSAPPAVTTAPSKSAKEERDTARRALEQGHAKDAVAAARRATELDPTDADSWLLLGAANQTMGHWKEARAAFTTCMKAAKKGPVRECRSMLR